MMQTLKSTQRPILRLWNTSLLVLTIWMMILTPVQGGPYPVCRICSRGAEVVPVAGGPDTTCNELREFGLNGEIPKVICDSLPVSLKGVCACRTVAPTRAPSPKPSTARPSSSAAPSPEPSTAAPSSAPSTEVPSATPTTLAPTSVPVTKAPATEAPAAVCSNILGPCSSDDGCCGGLVCRGATYCDRSFRLRAPKNAFNEATFRFENDLNLRQRGSGRQRGLKGSSSSSSADSSSSTTNTDMQGWRDEIPPAMA